MAQNFERPEKAMDAFKASVLLLKQLIMRYEPGFLRLGAKY